MIATRKEIKMADYSFVRLLVGYLGKRNSLDM